MKKMKNKIILASSSPRRKELFDKYGIDYTVDFVETEEVLDESLTLFKRLENIALQKAKPLQIKYPNNIIVSADTMVTFQDEMLGKPKNREDAKRMLELLSNNKQVVITAVCIIKDQQSTTFTDATTVTFKKLSDQEIEDYLDTNEWQCAAVCEGATLEFAHAKPAAEPSDAVPPNRTPRNASVVGMLV